MREAMEEIRKDAEQVVLRDGHALPKDVYILTRRIFVKASEALKVPEQAQGVTDEQREALVDKAYEYLQNAVHDPAKFGPRPSRGMVGQTVLMILQSVGLA